MIGIIDSGMGGLTTLATLAKAGCDHAFCYYADVAHAPYGALGPTAIMQATLAAAKQLLTLGASRLVLGCNTATVAALGYLRQTLPVPVYGVHPPVEAAQRMGGRTLLLATRFTSRHYRNREGLTVMALPRLATLIDAHFPNDVAPIETYCQEMLASIGGVDNLVLGCTHYALITPLLMRLTGASKVWDANDTLPPAEVGITACGAGLSIDVLASGSLDAQRYRAVLMRLLAE